MKQQITVISGTHCARFRGSKTCTCRCRSCCICPAALFHAGLKHSHIKLAVSSCVSTSQWYPAYNCTVTSARDVMFLPQFVSLVG